MVVGVFLDTLFQHVLLYTGSDTLKEAYVGVTGGQISYVGITPPDGVAARVVDGRGKILMPGLINAHTHLPMTLLRGYADDCALKSWLFDHIFPAEEQMRAADIRLGTTLALAEAMASGTTSLSDMYGFSTVIAECVAASGLKANIARGVTCLDDHFAPETHEGILESQALFDEWHGHDHGRILVDACIHAEYTSSPAVWTHMAEWAERNHLRMHVHVSETRGEHEECLSRRGMTPTAALAGAGVFSVPTTVAHGVYLTDGDMDLLAASNAVTVHCPISNAKLASGMARVRDMRARGLTVALGTDGAASNNTLDVFEEIKAAALVAKLQTGEPTAISARDALDMALLGGAAAQGRVGETGRIDVGFDADLILLDASRPHLTPVHRLESSLVYAARGQDVTLTMVRGRVLYERGEFLSIDREKLQFELAHSDYFDRINAPKREVTVRE